MPMRIKKLPLWDRLGRLAQGQPAYPEYAASVVRRVAETPIASYMASCPGELARLGAALGLTQERIATMAYADVAARIGRWYVSYSADEPLRHAAAVQAAALMAAPLIYEYRRCTPPSDDGDGDDGDFEEV